jgi:Tol biopolymer transport system component
MTGRLVMGGLAMSVVVRLSTIDDGLVMTVRQCDGARSAFGASTVDISADGRYVAFESFAQLVPADTDSGRDVYVLDRVTRTVTLETGAFDGDSSHPRIAGDGRVLVFEAMINAPDVTLLRTEIVVRDRMADTTKFITRLRGPPDGQSRAPDISDDGGVVVFTSSATNLLAGQDANGSGEDVYSYEVDSGTLRRISVDSAGVQPSTGASMLPSPSADGRRIAFISSALLDAEKGARPVRQEPPRPGRPVRQVYVRDTTLGTTTRLRAGDRDRAEADSGSPAISADGRYVAFVSESPNLVSADRNGMADVFLFDRFTGSTTLVSRAADGGSANGLSLNPTLSKDGRLVAFQSDASNLVCGKRCPAALEDINLLWDVFLFDREKQLVTRISVDELGGWMEPSAGPALSASGTVVAFSSRHPVDATDRGGDFDLFVRVTR